MCKELQVGYDVSISVTNTSWKCVRPCRPLLKLMFTNVLLDLFGERDVAPW